MTTGITVRPQIVQNPTVIQQAQRTEGANELNQVNDAAQNGQITDIAAMTQRMQVESKIQGAKSEPVKYVEQVVSKPTDGVVSETKQPTPNNITDVIKNFHRSRNYTNNERSQMLFDQMNQFALNNRILHGLI